MKLFFLNSHRAFTHILRNFSVATRDSSKYSSVGLVYPASLCRLSDVSLQTEPSSYMKTPLAYTLKAKGYGIVFSGIRLNSSSAGKTWTGTFPHLPLQQYCGLTIRITWPLLPSHLLSLYMMEMHVEASQAIHTPQLKLLVWKILHTGR